MGDIIFIALMIILFLSGLGLVMVCGGLQEY
jgi:hypothetical protein